MPFRQAMSRMQKSTLGSVAATAWLAWTLGANMLAAQGDVGIAPASPPVITDHNPKQAAAGDEVKVVIEGSNFAPGAWVSFSTPLAHAVATQRASATRLEVMVRIGKKAEAGAIFLYVSNPDSVATRAAFTIVAPPAPAPEPVKPPPAPAPPQPPTPPAPVKPAPGAAPEVLSVEPASAARGAQVELRITGRNFAPGAKVTFENSAIRTGEVRVNSSTELVAGIQVNPDAQPGETTLFVLNPDGQEVEVKFILLKEAAKAPAAPAKAEKPPAAKESAPGLRFEVYGVADVSAILQAQNKPKGALTLEGGKLRFEEAGKEVFSVLAADVKEVEVNTLFGMFTGTFHVTLRSGPTYNFVATSLKATDSQAMVDALKRALK